MNDKLTAELKRAQYLANRLNSAVNSAKKFGQAKAQMDVMEAEELCALLADSLKTAAQFDLVEFDGTVQPTQSQLRGIPHKVHGHG